MTSSHNSFGFALLNQRIATPLGDDPRKHKWLRREFNHQSAGRRIISTRPRVAVLDDGQCACQSPTSLRGAP